MIVPLTILTALIATPPPSSAPPEIILARQAEGPIWARHTIDDSSRGADGAGLGDIDGDGLTDIVTGWEEGGEVRVYRNPGPANARKRWPRVTVGNVRSPEDAIFVDIDGDGVMDIVSCCEGDTRTVFLHRRNPKDAGFLDPSRWTTKEIPSTVGSQAWMQATVLRTKRQPSMSLVLGSKNARASVGLMDLPVNGIGLDALRCRKLRDAGWIMSLIAHDMNADGDPDIVLTDRKGDRTGAFWLENPGNETELWQEHPIGALNREAMFADLGDVDGDGLLDIAVAVKPHDIVLCFRKNDGGWRETVLRLDSRRIGEAKAVKIADANGDGLADLIFTCEVANGDLEGVIWLEQTSGRQWKQRPLGGPEGTKFDMIRTLDMDGDNDPDVITCEEKDGLGVIWYENPRFGRE